MAQVPVRLIEADNAALTQVMNLTEEFVLNVTPDLSQLSQDEAGGVLRTISTATVLAYGDVATQASRISYDTMATATVGGGYAAVALDVPSKTYDLINPAVGRSMKAYTEKRYVDATAFLATSLSTAVGNLYRETTFTNSDFDERSTGWQRLTDGNPCAFCAYAAANYDSGLGSFDGEKSFHAKCGCRVVPVFDDDPYVTDTLEKYRADAVQARENILNRYFEDRKKARGLRPRDFYKQFPKDSVTTDNLVAEMRRLSKYKDFVENPYV